ncbi:MAG: hypothetical protein ABIP55_11360 [Tepidisphaeraceae bacterium]
MQIFVFGRIEITRPVTLFRHEKQATALVWRSIDVEIVQRTQVDPAVIESRKRYLRDTNMILRALEMTSLADVECGKAR